MDGKSFSLELTNGELVREWPPPQHQRRGVGKGVGGEGEGYPKRLDPVCIV